MIILRPKEKIISVYRRHQTVLISQLILEVLFFLFILIPMIVIAFSSIPSWPGWLMKILPDISSINLRFLILFFFSIFLPILWQVIFLTIVDYYLDCWILTNERIISTESKGLFHRDESSITYDKIQDITIEIKGIFPSLLDFGDLQIETAAEHGKDVFRQIPNPEKVKEVIFELQQEFLEKKNINVTTE